MNCESCRQQLLDLVYGEGEQTAEAETHLSACPDCRAYYQSLREVQDLLGDLPMPDESGFREVKAALREADVLAEKRKLIFDLVKFGAVLVMIVSLYALIYSWSGPEGFAVFYLAVFLSVSLSLIPLRRWAAKGDGR